MNPNLERVIQRAIDDRNPAIIEVYGDFHVRRDWQLSELCQKIGTLIREANAATHRR